MAVKDGEGASPEAGGGGAPVETPEGRCSSQNSTSCWRVITGDPCLHQLCPSDRKWVGITGGGGLS